MCENEIKRLEKEKVLPICTDEEYDQMTDETIFQHLKDIHKFNPAESAETAREKLKQYERTIRLKYWHDTSSVANHGYVLMTVKPSYNPAPFLRPKEVPVSVFSDIHTTVETPQLYFLARSSSSDAEQLTYMDTILQDTIELKTHKIKTSKGSDIQFIVRFFDGNGPAQHFETGERNGGNDGCSGCVSDGRRFWDLGYTFRAEHLTLEERRDIVFAGPAGQNARNGGIRPFDNMKKDELLDELISRNVKGHIN